MKYLLVLPIAGLMFAAPSFTGGDRAVAQSCQPYVITAYGKSAAAFKKARTRRAKRRAVRRWERAVEGRLLGARGVEIPAAGTDYSNIKNAQIVSFNCNGRPLKCVLRARPCSAG